MKIKGWHLHNEGRGFVQWATDRYRLRATFFGEEMPVAQPKAYMLSITRQVYRGWVVNLSEWNGKDTSSLISLDQAQYPLMGQYRTREGATRAALSFMKTHRV